MEMKKFQERIVLVHHINSVPVLMSPEQLDINIPAEDLEEIKHLNVTDEEKEQRLALESP